MKKCQLKNDAMNESQLQRVSDCKKHPRDRIITTNKGFINIDDGSQGGTHCVCFIIKHNKSFNFDSFGGAPDKFLLKQLPNQ